MKYLISQICDINVSTIDRGGGIKRIKYLDTANLTKNNIDSVQEIDIADAPSRAQRKVKNKTILYSTVRPILCHFGILENPEYNMIVSTGFATLDIKEEYQEYINPFYLYYLITSPYITEYLQILAEGSVSAYPSISPNQLGSLEFEFPSIKEQNRIARALHTLDRKVEINTQINRELEQMAQELYDYWFVQFDFPDENGKPYKSSGGRMVWNEALKKEIPEGWSVIPMKEIAFYPSTNSSLFDNYITTDNMLQDKRGVVLNIKRPSYGSCTGYQKNDTLISNIRPYLKKIWLADREGAVSNDVLCIRATEIEYSFFLYLTLFRDSFFDYDMKGAKGTKMPRGDRNHIMNYPVVTPPKGDLLESFTNIIDRAMGVISNNIKQNRELDQCLSNILPLLMTGQATLKDK